MKSHQKVVGSLLSLRAPKSNFSVQWVKGWAYQDKYPQRTVNPISFFQSSQDHLVLADKTGAPRAVLNFHRKDGFFKIGSIQLERTQYVPIKNDGCMKWVPALEKQATSRLRQELGGVYPTEASLSEFLFLHREQIKSEQDVRMFVSPNNIALGIPNLDKLLYRPLLDRFFKKMPGEDGELGWYQLSFAKRRVREALGLE